MAHINPTTGLPEPNSGRNPPRYDSWYARRTAKVVAAAVVAFALAIGIFFFFA
jgi:hypothetical protein